MKNGIMVLLNNYFHTNKQANKGSISVSGKLEAYIGNYYVSGEGIPGENILLIYCDPNVDSLYGEVECKKENLIACMTADYEYVFVKNTLLQKFREDISEYNSTIIPISDFDLQECCVKETEYLPDFLSNIRWINDDFLSDENLDFDFKAFETIDEGVDYLNPNHFSVNELIMFIRSYRTI